MCLTWLVDRKQHLMWAVPSTWFSTWLAWIYAAHVTFAMVASSLAGLTTRWACGATVAGHTAGMTA